jgi:hypothetical protein
MSMTSNLKFTVVLAISKTSGHFEWASMTTKCEVPKHGPCGFFATVGMAISMGAKVPLMEIA